MSSSYLKFPLVFVLFFCTSCASYFTRKECEKVDWFQHAHGIAMSGKRLEEDNRLKQCEKAETEINSATLDQGFKKGMANYCQWDTAHNKGASGDQFNYDFCETNLVPRLKEKFLEGLKKFCQPENASIFASNGGIYNNQCSKEAEALYIPKYRAGRKIYLANKIASHESQISSIYSEINVEQGRARQVTYLIATLPRTSVVSKTKKYDESSKTFTEQTSVTEDPNIQRKREELEYELQSIDRKISEKQEEQRKLRNEVHTLQSELEGLKSSKNT